MLSRMTILRDFSFNLLATLLPILLIQFVIFPSIAERVANEEYGLFLSVYSYLNLLPSTIGNAINNIRLIRNNEYKRLNINGDFSIIIHIGQCINLLVSVLVYFYYFNIVKITDTFFLIFASMIWLYREYYLVTYRITLDYKSVLINSIIVTVGSCIAFLIFLCSDFLFLFFVFPQALSLVHIICTTNLHKERCIRTPLFVTVTRDSLIMLATAFLSRLISYADKIILYPILGGAAVSVYYIAGLLGKSLGLAIGPMNSVALSYLAGYDNKPENVMEKVSIWSFLLCVLSYFFAIGLGEPLLCYLYPLQYKMVLPYINIATMAMMTMIYSSVINPFVLKFCDLKWQIYINVMSSTMYVLLGVVAAKYYGLYGFCIVIIIINAFKTLASFLVYRYR